MDWLISILIVGVFVAIIGWFIYIQLRTMYDRYIREYRFEIREYLIANSLTLVEIRYPNKFDWMDQCFPEPHFAKLGFVLVQINHLYSTWSDKRYKVIETVNESEESVRVWLEIYTEFFSKTRLTFRQKVLKTYFGPKEGNLDTETVLVSGKCPACGWSLNGNEEICPECELHFQ